MRSLKAICGNSMGVVLCFCSLADQQLNFCIAVGLPGKCVTIMNDLMSTDVIKVKAKEII